MDEDTRLLVNVTESAIRLLNSIVEQLPPEAKTNFNSAVFTGAKVKVECEVSPAPAIRGTLELNGQKIELFAVQFKTDGPSPILN